MSKTTTAQVKAAKPFEHDGQSFSAGVHTVPIETAKAIIDAKKAESFSKKAAPAKKDGE